MENETPLLDLSRSIGRIEGKLDAALALEPRVAALERGRAWMVGAGAALGALVPAAAWAYDKMI